MAPEEDLLITEEERLIFYNFNLIDIQKTALLNEVRFKAIVPETYRDLTNAGFFYSTDANKDLLYETAQSYDQLEASYQSGDISKISIPFDTLKLNADTIAYTYQFSNAEVGGTYHFRAFAFFEEEFKGQVQRRRYIENTPANFSSIMLTEGWYKQPFEGNLFERADAFSFYNPDDNTVTVGGGCEHISHCGRTIQAYPFLSFAAPTSDGVTPISPLKTPDDGFLEFAGDLNNRANAVSFRLGDSIYIGTGLIDNDVLSNFHVYHPDNVYGLVPMSPPAEFAPRTTAISFTIKEMAYVGLGQDNNATFSSPKTKAFGDIWRYNSTSDEVSKGWRKMVLIEEEQSEKIMIPRKGAVALTVNDEFAIVGGGLDAENESRTEFWELWPMEGKDTILVRTMSNLPIDLAGGIGFTIAEEVYVGLGSTTNAIFKYTGNDWEELSSIPSLKIGDGVGFSINNRGYVFSGVQSNQEISNNLWIYVPK